MTDEETERVQCSHGQDDTVIVCAMNSRVKYIRQN